VDTDEDEPEYEEEDTPLSGETEPGDDFLLSDDDLGEFSVADPTAPKEE
jgi:hypothetical protein